MFTTILASISSAIPFITKHYKQILFGLLFVWAVICSLTHCRHISPWDDHTTTTVQIDTIYVYPDTNAIFALHGFDTLPKYVTHLQSTIGFRPKTPNFSNDSSARDSLATLWSVCEYLSNTILECDSMYQDLALVRGYSDTLRNDSIAINLSFETQGKLLGEPKIEYKYLAPYPVITEIRTINHPAKVYRKLYAEAALGPRLNWKQNELATVVGTLGVGFTDKKDWSYGISADFSHTDYAVKFAVRKSVSIGSR